MGLDIVELVILVEDKFRVRLADAECERIGTVADLAALVISKLPKSPAACLTARTFYNVRSHLLAHCDTQRRLVRPSTRIRELIPNGLKGAWRRLRSANAEIPQLVPNPAIDLLMCWAAGILAFLGLMFGVVVVKEWGACIAAPVLIGLATLIIGIHALTKNVLGSNLPMGIVTVGDLVRYLAPVVLPEEGSGHRLIVQQRVLEEVREITASMLGIPLERVQPSSHFVRDLNLG